MGRGGGDDAGGILGVAAVVAEHGDALDYDLFDRWRVRLRDVPDSVGWDAVALFLRHLPPDSATVREMEPSALWSTEAHLLATVVDQLSALMHGLGGGRGPAPRPVPRPGREDAFVGAVPVDAESLNERLATVTWKDV